MLNQLNPSTLQLLSAFDIKVVIPAKNEAAAIVKVLAEMPEWISEVIVVDNGSTDTTAQRAIARGATVISEPISGYGRACLAGIKAAGTCDVIVFIDGDASDVPAEMARLVLPIITGTQDFVLGSRLAGSVEPGALTVQQRFGNSLACFLMKLFWSGTYTDLGPFRAIRLSALKTLDMQAPTFGWTVEMQVRALKNNLRIAEVPVSYRRRIGISKISGTVKGVILAGTYILGTIGWEAIKPARHRKTARQHSQVTHLPAE